MSLFYRIWFAYRCFRVTKDGGVHYLTGTCYGVPRYCAMIGSGREAWQVSDVTTDYFARRGVYLTRGTQEER